MPYCQSQVKTDLQCSMYGDCQWIMNEPYKTLKCVIKALLQPCG